MICSYVLDKLKLNAINFAFFVGGVLLGFVIVLLAYTIVSKTKKKSAPLKKKYEEVAPEKDLPLIAAKTRMRSAAQNVAIADYVSEAAATIVEMICRIAKEYTGGERILKLGYTDFEGTEKLNLIIDPDFTVENLLKFIDGAMDVLENTVLSVTDRFAFALNPVLKALNLGDSFRNVTAKNVIIYVKKSAEKERKALAKKEEKLIKKSEKRAERDDKKNKPRRRLRDLFKKKKNPVQAIVEITEEEKIRSYVKIVNSVILNVVLETLPDLAKNARKLYGDGYEVEG